MEPQRRSGWRAAAPTAQAETDITTLWGAANRDPSAFRSPASCDLARAHPKGHVAFGSGIHFCLGAPLARLEAKVALEELLLRTRAVELMDDVRHVPSLFVRRVERLEVALG